MMYDLFLEKRSSFIDQMLLTTLMHLYVCDIFSAGGLRYFGPALQVLLLGPFLLMCGKEGCVI